MLEELERKRTQLVRELHAVGAAIKAYAQTIGHTGAVKKGRTTKSGKRTMSAATKKKLSIAAKKRWAAVKKE